MRIAFLLLGLAACLPNTQLDVTKSGAGSGTVTSDPNGISCGAQCVMIMDAEGVIDATATPADGDAFRGWSGDCTGVGTCTIDSSFNAEVDARFEKVSTVTVQMTGSPVEVQSQPPGLVCVDGTCTGEFARGTDVVLYAPQLPALHFDGWTGACHGTDSSCALRIGDEPIETRIAYRRLFALTIAATGDGYLVAPGVACRYQGCVTLVPEADTIALQAQPGPQSDQIVWTGDCAGTAGTTCNVLMSRARSVGIDFH